MKRVLYFDASAGVSGDMFVGALIDLGASLDVVRNHVATLGVGGIRLESRAVLRHGIAATKFEVLDPVTRRPVDEVAVPSAKGEQPLPDEHHGDPHHHSHDHRHQEHGGRHGPHSHEGGGNHVHAHDSHPHDHRDLSAIGGLLACADLPPEVSRDALGVFELLARAEGKIHGTRPEDVHFHEVGALDSIADIVAAASAYHQLGVEECWCSPIHVGCGTVRCAHGLLPIPAPATAELLRGAPVYSDGTPGELATPTGAALVRYFSHGFRPLPPMVVEAVGYGAGTKDFGLPNVFRAILGESFSTDTALQAMNNR